MRPWFELFKTNPVYEFDRKLVIPCLRVKQPSKCYGAWQLPDTKLLL